MPNSDIIEYTKYPDGTTLKKIMLQFNLSLPEINSLNGTTYTVSDMNTYLYSLRSGEEDPLLLPSSKVKAVYEYDDISSGIAFTGYEPVQQPPIQSVPVSYLYAIEDKEEFLLNEFGEKVSEDQRNEDGTITKDALIREIIGTSQTHQNQSSLDFDDILKILSLGITGVALNAFEAERDRQQTLYDAVLENQALLSEILLSEEMSADVQVWLNGADIATWDTDDILKMQLELIPLYQHPEFQGPMNVEVLGAEEHHRIYDVIEQTPIDPNQATREMYEAYLSSGHTNLDLYYEGDPNNPNFDALADAYRITLMEKNYIMMSYNDGFSQWGHVPSFEEFQAAFIGVPTEEISTLGMELSYNTMNKLMFDATVVDGLPPYVDADTLLNLSDYRYLMGPFDEYPDMDDMDLYNHLLKTGVIDTPSLRTQLEIQGLNPEGLPLVDERIVADAAMDATEMGMAYWGSTALDESRQDIDEGWAEEHRRLLSELKGEIGNMPSGSIFGKPVGQARTLFSNYHDAEQAKLDDMLNGVLNYEVERYENIQEQEALDQISLPIQFLAGAFSDVADVALILREWKITDEMPKFDTLVTLLPFINYGMRKAWGKGLNLIDLGGDLFHHGDEIVGATDEVADVTEIINRFVDGKYVSDYMPRPPSRGVAGTRFAGAFRDEQTVSLSQRGVRIVTDADVELGKARAGFDPSDPNDMRLLLREGATKYEFYHELSHVDHYEDIGRDAYMWLNRDSSTKYLKELYVWKKLREGVPDGYLNPAELRDAAKSILVSRENVSTNLDIVKNDTLAALKSFQKQFPNIDLGIDEAFLSESWLLTDDLIDASYKYKDNFQEAWRK